MKKLLYVSLAFIILILLAEGGYFYKTDKRHQSVGSTPTNIKVEPGEYVTLERIDAYQSPKEANISGYINPGRYFFIKEQKENWLSIKTTREQFSWEGWIKINSSVYRIVKGK